MGIDGIQGKHDTQPVERPSGHHQDPKSRSIDASPETDLVQLSEQSQEFTRIRKLADGLPEIRQDRVDRLRSEIGRGTYRVSGEDIADAVVRESQIDLTSL